MFRSLFDLGTFAHFAFECACLCVCVRARGRETETWMQCDSDRKKAEGDKAVPKRQLPVKVSNNPSHYGCRCGL